jgi:hypothetical protein
MIKGRGGQGKGGEGKGGEAKEGRGGEGKEGREGREGRMGWGEPPPKTNPGYGSAVRLLTRGNTHGTGALPDCSVRPPNRTSTYSRI